MSEQSMQDDEQREETIDDLEPPADDAEAVKGGWRSDDESPKE